jgi:CheY-specific phosphatase CheX
MSSVVGNGALTNEQSKRSYVATDVFNTAFFSYTSVRNASNQLEYTLAVNPLATSNNCKAGHILKENGRKLVVGVNPGVTTYMVGVFDSSSLLNGFIDPNNNRFAVYSTNVPNFIDRGIDSVTAIDGTTNDMGPSVFTNGLVTAARDIISTNGDIEAENGSVMASSNVIAGTGVMSTTGDITALDGNLVISPSTTTGRGKLNVPSTGANAIVGNVSMASGSIVTSFKKTLVNTTAVTANSKIFLTYTGLNGPGFLSAESIIAGTSFLVVSSNTADLGTVNWFIIN